MEGRLFFCPIFPSQLPNPQWTHVRSKPAPPFMWMLTLSHLFFWNNELFGRVFLEGKTQRENPKGKKRKTHQKNPKSFS